jgi:hypothetical protein
MYNDEDTWIQPPKKVSTNETKLNDIIKKTKELKNLLSELLEDTKINNNTFDLHISVWNNENINGDNSGNKLQLCENLQKMRQTFHNNKIEKQKKELEMECKELEKELEEKKNEKLNLQFNMDMDMNMDMDYK